MYDIIVIGSGPGGYVAAIRAAQLGRRVAVVERDRPGGVCLNWGCIPTKALIRSAEIYETLGRASDYGIDVASVTADISKITARSRAVAETMGKGVAFLLRKNNIDLVEGTGRVKAPGLVGVSSASDGSEIELRTGHIILATGARPREIASLPIDGEHIIGYHSAMTPERLPASMVIVGSGAIGCEFAHFYATMGTKVTLIEYLPAILPLCDEEVSKYMERIFRRRRINVLTATEVKKVEVADGRCLVDIESRKGAERLEADVVLSAVGIKSNIEGLGLEELGVRTERDKVVVDANYRTNIEGICAIGDIIPTPALAHVASVEATVCVEAICDLSPGPVDYASIPSAVYTHPEVSSVGLTEREAMEAGYELRIGRFPFTASGRAAAAGERDGFVKLIFDAAGGKLLGAHIVGAGASEMIAEAVAAKALGADAELLASLIHSHPTMSEGIMEAAADALGHAIHK